MKMEDAPRVCSNCRGPHTASCRGCPAATEYLKRFKPPVNKQKLFSDVIKSQTNNNKPSSGSAQIRKSQVNMKPVENETKRRDKQTNKHYLIVQRRSSKTVWREFNYYDD